ncbi:hypothetical protein EDB85DRAFT_2273164 [Lactarius pseudohatsudake]|nr:hypothetical protein EDB85DRAFT_2273164 [Lactarius pseudohatsudake]
MIVEKAKRRKMVADDKCRRKTGKTSHPSGVKRSTDSALTPSIATIVISFSLRAPSYPYTGIFSLEFRLGNWRYSCWIKGLAIQYHEITSSSVAAFAVAEPGEPCLKPHACQQMLRGKTLGDAPPALDPNRNERQWPVAAARNVAHGTQAELHIHAAFRVPALDLERPPIGRRTYQRKTKIPQTRRRRFRGRIFPPSAIEGSKRRPTSEQCPIDPGYAARSSGEIKQFNLPPRYAPFDGYDHMRMAPVVEGRLLGHLANKGKCAQIRHGTQRPPFRTANPVSGHVHDSDKKPDQQQRYMMTSGVLRKALRRDVRTVVETTEKAVLNHMNISDHSADLFDTRIYSWGCRPEPPVRGSRCLSGCCAAERTEAPLEPRLLTAVSVSSRRLPTRCVQTEFPGLQNDKSQVARLNVRLERWSEVHAVVLSLVTVGRPGGQPCATHLAAGNYLSHIPTGSPSTRARTSVGGIRLGTMAVWLLYEIKASKVPVGTWAAINRLLAKATLRDADAPVEIVSQTDGSYYPNPAERLADRRAGPRFGTLGPWTQHSYITQTAGTQIECDDRAINTAAFTSAFRIRR